MTSLTELKGRADRKMPGAGGLSFVPGKVVTVFEADRADREVEPDAQPHRDFG